VRSGQKSGEVEKEKERKRAHQGKRINTQRRDFTTFSALYWSQKNPKREGGEGGEKGEKKENGKVAGKGGRVANGVISFMLGGKVCGKREGKGKRKGEEREHTHKKTKGDW